MAEQPIDTLYSAKSKKIVLVCQSKVWREDFVSELQSAHPDWKFEEIRSPDRLTLEYLKGLDPTYIFFPHWSFIIPADIYSSYECVVFHMTDLPYGRGGSPLQNLILRGHKKTMMSALRCNNVLDGGDIYLKLPLGLNGSAVEIFDRAAGVISQMITMMLTDRMVPIPQSGEVVPFVRRTPEESYLDFSESNLEKIYDFIRMLDAPGYPQAFLQKDNVRLEFNAAQWNAETGELLASVRITNKK